MQGYRSGGWFHVENTRGRADQPSGRGHAHSTSFPARLRSDTRCAHQRGCDQSRVEQSSSTGRDHLEGCPLRSDGPMARRAAVHARGTRSKGMVEYECESRRDHRREGISCTRDISRITADGGSHRNQIAGWSGAGCQLQCAMARSECAVTGPAEAGLYVRPVANTWPAPRKRSTERRPAGKQLLRRTRRSTPFDDGRASIRVRLTGDSAPRMPAAGR